MKKVLFLLLVFGLASVANAALQISVNGEPEPVNSEIILAPSDTLILDIWTDADIAPFVGHTWAIVCDTMEGTISGGVAIDLGADVINQINGRTEDAATVIPPPGEEGIWGSVFNLSGTGASIAQGTVIVDEILFHCELGGTPQDPLDIVIGLYEVVEGQQMVEPMDTVIIHQIPEPMTVALLGFGGLLLLRRRK